jgi:dipeptidase E
MEDRPSPIDAHLLRLTGKSRPRVCFVPTASGDLPDHIDKFYATFAQLRCEATHLSFFGRPSPRAIPLTSFRDALGECDAIYFGGGSTKSALAVWREWRADEVFRHVYSRGVLLAGMSAGAMCWFEAALTDSYWSAGYQPLKGLGVLPGGCGVHYHSDPNRSLRLHAALQASAVPPSIGIDDFAAVLFVNESAAEVFSWAPGSGAYSVSCKNGRVEESALQCTTLPKRTSGPRY